MDRDKALEAAQAVERGEAPSGSVILAVTGPNSLHSTTPPAHPARPDDDPEPGDRCKDCGEPITWLGPSMTDWEHTADAPVEVLVHVYDYERCDLGLDPYEDNVCQHGQHVRWRYV